MAGRLSKAASRIMGANGVVSRSVASSFRQRSGMGLPVGKHIVPDKPLPVNDELVWDNGTPFPEPCIDRIADTVGKYEALAWLCGGLSFFASLGFLAVWNDKASKIPFLDNNTSYHFLMICLYLVMQSDVIMNFLSSAMFLLFYEAPKIYPYDNLRVELGEEP
ncbi:NADH dehydrogenase [ubiquinone] 1 beta subcomplex subunit 8, mitochondrial-like isoform X1 [Primulina huaijiensis]|uniref:NADH dehydrogenase [ubiquinone] 1 beta subcomplex subunit 8, mitochondrial-like isoform X1 n=1 Tax=Primulina huaijiensis TaxID=1492673 RepID=UPI003CC76E69